MFFSIIARTLKNVDLEYPCQHSFGLRQWIGTKEICKTFVKSKVDVIRMPRKSSEFSIRSLLLPRQLRSFWLSIEYAKVMKNWALLKNISPFAKNARRQFLYKNLIAWPLHWSSNKQNSRYMWHKLCIYSTYIEISYSPKVVYWERQTYDKNPGLLLSIGILMLRGNVFTL